MLYGTVLGLRTFCYRTGLLRSTSFDIPTISVGNLSVGGTGKTPHIEYLIRLLSPYIQVATLSRGYGRKTEGFRFVEQNSTPQEVGDEPLQFKLKYPDVPVAVGESRSFAIPQLLQKNGHVRTILLDDAYQHLAVKPYLNILLTDYARPFTHDLVLPAGMLREWPSGYQRADIIIITKCPNTLSTQEKAKWIAEINPYAHQKVFFSKFEYKTPYPLISSPKSAQEAFAQSEVFLNMPTNNNQRSPLGVEASIYGVSSKADQLPTTNHQLSTNLDIVLLCAIAKVDYLLSHLKKTVKSVTTIEFEDHRFFTNYDIAQAKKTFDNLDSKNKIILTTEKDMVRLQQHQPYISEHKLPIYVLPIEVEFLFNEGKAFDEEIKKKLLEFKI
jgi:tetraacyldisaccharide 4'-kinase